MSKITINLNIDRLTDKITVNHPSDIQKCNDNIIEKIRNSLRACRLAEPLATYPQGISIEMKIETLERDKAQILEQLKWAVPRLTRPNRGKLVKSYPQQPLKEVLEKVEDLLTVETALEDYYRQYK